MFLSNMFNLFFQSGYFLFFLVKLPVQIINNMEFCTCESSQGRSSICSIHLRVTRQLSSHYLVRERCIYITLISASLLTSSNNYFIRLSIMIISKRDHNIFIKIISYLISGRSVNPCGHQRRSLSDGRRSHRHGDVSSE